MGEYVYMGTVGEANLHGEPRHSGVYETAIRLLIASHVNGYFFRRWL
jgi:hypothetical protein